MTTDPRCQSLPRMQPFSGPNHMYVCNMKPNEPSRIARWFIFTQKYLFGSISKGLGLENVYIFNDYLMYLCTAPSQFWFVALRKIWQPGPYFC
jgi:hypothetical protein